MKTSNFQKLYSQFSIFNFQFTKGFTLSEMIIVVSIIMLLVATSIVAYNTSLKSARDQKRITDMQAIRTALQLYYQEHDDYPFFPHGEMIGEGGLFDTAIADYLDPIPKDPIHDGIDFYYAYDSQHINNPPVSLDNPNGQGLYGSCADTTSSPSNPNVVVIGFKTAESKSTKLSKQTCSGGDMDINIFDYNLTFSPSNP